MDGKKLAVVLSILGLVAVAIMGRNQASQASPFEAWKH